MTVPPGQHAPLDAAREEQRRATTAATGLGMLAWLRRLKWIDGAPLITRVEPYRQRLLEQAESLDPMTGWPRYSRILSGRAKKNWKSADAILFALKVLNGDAVSGNQVYIVANDAGQARDDLDLAKKVVAANPALAEWCRARKNSIERRDGLGVIEVLPAQDAIGQHGKTYRLLVIDEIHGYRGYDLLEALAPDPTRLDAQQWVTSYASIFHRPGVPLFDMLAAGKAGTDPELLFSWYAADYTTDPDYRDASPEDRANPSRSTWGNPTYLAQQQRRLPSHKYRRLHLNLPGLPEGSAYAAEPIIDAIDRGVHSRPRCSDVRYVAFVDMSGGSSDDAVLAIAHRDALGRVILDLVIDQGPRPPFDPNAAVTRFARVLQAYGIVQVTGDNYAGETFKTQFERLGIAYASSSHTASELYEEFEAVVNAKETRLVDVPMLEQQLLGLVWRGGRIDHQAGEHDDYANAAVGACLLARPGAADAWLTYAKQVVDAARGTRRVCRHCEAAGRPSNIDDLGLTICHRCHHALDDTRPSDTPRPRSLERITE